MPQHEHAPITIHDSSDSADEAAKPHHMATIERAMRFNQSVTVERVDVYLNTRGVYATQPEWLENAIVIRYRNTERAPMTIGAIQRTPASDSEFHS